MTKIKELLDSWLLIQPGSKRHTQQLSPQLVAAWNHACHALFSQHSRTRGALSKWQPIMCVFGMDSVFPFHIQRKPI